MHGVTGFLEDLALVFCAAGLASVVFQRLKQPVVLGYLLAGLVLSPNFEPVPLTPDVDTVQTLSELGVILLMFSLGLDFRVRHIVRMGGRAGVAMGLEVGLMAWLGFLGGRALGWSPEASVFGAGMAAISSTMVIRKTFEDIEVDPRVSRLVYGILIFEDIAAILLLATLTAVAAGEEVTFAAFVGRGLRLAGFLVALTIAGLFLVPRLVRFVLRMQSTETTAIAAVGICFAFAVLARSFGYSVALGAFIAGAVVAESGKSRVIDAAIRPVRDLFAAVFFVSIGMLVDLGQVWESWPAVLVFTGIVVVGKGLGVTAGAMLTGHRPQVAVRAAMSMMQIGEFSLLMAGLAAGLGPAGAAVAPVAVAVTVLTTFITPWAVRWSGWTAEHFDRWLPARVQTFVTLWGTWIEGAPAPAQAPRRDVRRLVFLLAVDALILAGVSIAVSLNLELLVQRFHAWTGVRDAWIETGVIVLAILACFPFARGIVACARRLGQILSERALPLPGAKGLDLALAPRIGLALGLQSGIVLVVLLFVLALTQPFLPSLPSIGALVLALALIAFLIWRNAASLQGHARAGAEMVVEILARQSHDEQPPDLQPMRAMLPGLGELTPVEITAGCRGADQTLAELNVRGATGTSVVCITRGDQGLVFPSQDERLLPGDVVVLSGKRRALRDARELLAGPSSAKTGRG
jgi:CPA2 family monovalent cation:H+ antiporter-2